MHTTGAYRLLILDRHGSHATAGFDRFCMEKKIILYIYLLISSYLLQPLDVSCFIPLKYLLVREYKKRCRKKSTQLKRKTLSIFIQQSINRLYPHQISSGFEATSLVSLLLERVLSKLQKIPTLPFISYSN